MKKQRDHHLIFLIGDQYEHGATFARGGGSLMIDLDCSRTKRFHWKPNIKDPLFIIYKGIKKAISSDYSCICIKDNNDEIVKRILIAHDKENKGKKFYIFCSTAEDWKLLTEQYHVLIHKEKPIDSFYINHPIHIMNLDIYGLFGNNP